jgi:hypothetical protein
MGSRTCLGHITDIVHYIGGYDFVTNISATTTRAAKFPVGYF